MEESCRSHYYYFCLIKGKKILWRVFTSGSHSANSATSSALRELIRSSRSSRLTLVGATWRQNYWLLHLHDDGLYLLYHLVHGEDCVCVCEDQQQYGNISLSLPASAELRNYKTIRVSKLLKRSRTQNWGLRIQEQEVFTWRLGIGIRFLVTKSNSRTLCLYNIFTFPKDWPRGCWGELWSSNCQGNKC